jgi:hypothetical protein
MRGRRPDGPDTGSISLFVALCAAGLVVVIGIVLECGGRLRAIEQADACAQEAARVVGQQLDETAALQGKGYLIRPDQPSAQQAVDDYLSLAPCNRMRGAVSFKDDRTVQVRVDTQYDTALLAGVGVTSLAVSGQGVATLVYGIKDAENG